MAPDLATASDQADLAQRSKELLGLHCTQKPYHGPNANVVVCLLPLSDESPQQPGYSSANKYSKSAFERLRAKPSSPSTSAIVCALLCCSSQIFSSTVPGAMSR